MSDNVSNTKFTAAVYFILAAVAFALPSFLTASSHQNHAGHLLIAASEQIMAGPFSHTVIYLSQHSSFGAFGLVINQTAKDKQPSGAFYGGPVERHRRFVLHSAEILLPDSFELSGGTGLAMTEDKSVDTMLEKMAKGEGPRKARLFFGYAGWAPGQLDGEIRMGHWKVIPYEERLVFSEAPETVWELADKQENLDITKAP